jgi:hypothetical protein
LWVDPEYPACPEFDSVEVRRLWCDGFVPHEIDVRSTEPCIRGRAWIADAKGEQEFAD